MKQTPVQWLIEQITLYDEINEYHKAVFEEAMKMEAEIPELSDEEIKKVAERFEQHEFYGAGRVFIKGAIWYREQLKQRQ